MGVVNISVKPEMKAQSKCALTNQQVCVVLNMKLRALEIKTPAVFLAVAAAKCFGSGCGFRGPSCFAVSGICLYDTVVSCSDLRQGV